MVAAVVVDRFGFETGNKVVHGLWTSRSYLNLLDFLATNNFNAIRVLDPPSTPAIAPARALTRTAHAAHAHAARTQIPFYLDLVLNDAQPSSINYGANPDLQGLSSMQVMDKVVQAAAARGLLIMFDLHSFLVGGLDTQHHHRIAIETRLTSRACGGVWR